MKSDLNRFNWLSRNYDSLTKLVFGKAIFESQVHFLPLIKPGARVLILGGGSGELLLSLGRGNPHCQVCYVEASSGMLALARKKTAGKFTENVQFIHGTEESIPEGVIFDAAITNFFLDLYPEDRLLGLCRQVIPKLHDGGLWLVSDFVDGGRWWHRIMLWLMYRFFVLTCRIEATRLPAWNYLLSLSGMRQREVKLFFGEFIKSAVYTRKT
ncbi:MAG TPA: class I SAM-dependent methyltransferase [Chryseosolibacter sp.]|nr:class I SAM-dependent methyltransferase [Chryseosolibacter sp.]